MTLEDLLRFLMRIVHVGAMAAWLGGGFYLLLLNSSFVTLATKNVPAISSPELRRLLRLAFALVLVSGVYLLFDRLPEPRLGYAYLGVVTLKVLIVLAIVFLTGLGRSRKPSNTRQVSADAQGAPGAPGGRGGARLNKGFAICALGTGAMILGVILTLIYEDTIGGR